MYNDSLVILVILLLVQCYRLHSIYVRDVLSLISEKMHT